MGKRGLYAQIEGLPGPQHAFAEAVRSLCSVIDTSLRDISRELERRDSVNYVSKSVLSDLVNGKRKRPERRSLKALYALAEERAAVRGLPVMSWDDLEKLRTAAMVVHCSPTASFCVDCAAAHHAQPVAGPVPGPASKEPAGHIVAHDDIGHLVAQDVLPVPPEQGDRQPSETTEARWQAVDDLTFRMAANQHADAAAILRHVGLEAAPEETALAIASCRAQGLVDAAEVLLKYASMRSDHDVLIIVSGLFKRKQQLVAGTLLELVLGT